jgi:protein-disulfide isomerase
MKDFFNRNKVFIGIILITAILLIGGVFLFTKNGGNTNQKGKSVNMSLLIPQNAIATSGIENGIYLPASASATVNLVEFGDYECPACGIYSPFVKQLLTDFAGKITYVFRNYPLPQHKNAPISSYTVEAAGLQGKYWEMHEKMFNTQGDWSNLSDPKEVFMGYAKDLGLDINKFTNDINSSTVKEKVQNDTNDGNTIGLTETPTFYLNGQQIALSGTYDQFKALVQSALAK